MTDWRKDQRRKDKIARAEAEETLRWAERLEWDIERGLIEPTFLVKLGLWIAKFGAKTSLRISDSIDREVGEK